MVILCRRATPPTTNFTPVRTATADQHHLTPAAAATSSPANSAAALQAAVRGFAAVTSSIDDATHNTDAVNAADGT
jgi:hypothetical protein